MLQVISISKPLSLPHYKALWDRPLWLWCGTCSDFCSSSCSGLLFWLLFWRPIPIPVLVSYSYSCSGVLFLFWCPIPVHTAALAGTLAEVRSGWGPVAGIVHGAGVVADALIADKTQDQFNRVFDPKVEGLRSLLAATADDPLEVLCAFSSVAAQFGNPGQCDYAMADEDVDDQGMSAEQARRTGCVVRAIGWGPWQGGMVTSELADRFRNAGVALIDPDVGAGAFSAEIADPAQEVRVILAADAGARPEGGLAAQVTVAGRPTPTSRTTRSAGFPWFPSRLCWTGSLVRRAPGVRPRAR